MFYSDTESQTKAKFSTQKKVDIYFRSKESYKIMEKIVSCAPMLLSVPLLVAFSYHQISVNEVAIGSLVAVLPRSLQLFQNIHSANMSTSQILLLKNKIAKIYSISSTLTWYDYPLSINHSKVSVTNTRDNKKIKISDFLNHEFINRLPNGRLLIMGGNGAGKSSAMKYSMSKYADALFFGPGIDIGEGGFLGSTGQKQLHQLKCLSDKKTNYFYG